MGGGGEVKNTDFSVSYEWTLPNVYVQELVEASYFNFW